MNNNPSKLRNLLALNVKAQRKKLGISQEALADAANLHRTYVGAVERGERNVSIDNIERLTSALGLPASELIADVQ